MDRTLTLLFLGLLSTVAAATEAPTFKSLYGFELAYPECWGVTNQEEEFNGPLEKSRSLFLQETAKCARPKLSADVPNGLSVTLFKSFKDNTEAATRFSALEERVKVSIKTEGLERKIAGYRKYKVDGADALTYAEIQPNGELLYSTVIHCGLRAVNLTGPQVKKPADKVMKQIQAGEIVIPETEGTIVQSFRCRK